MSHPYTMQITGQDSINLIMLLNITGPLPDWWITLRQQKILRGLLEGRSVEAIAAKLSCSVEKMQQEKSRLLSQLDLPLNIDLGQLPLSLELELKRIAKIPPRRRKK